MLRDRFVPFDVAVMLSEAGFPQDGYYFHGWFVLVPFTSSGKIFERGMIIDDYYFGKVISRPTCSIVLDWLRTEKHIHVCVIPVTGDDDSVLYRASVYDISGPVCILTCDEVNADSGEAEICAIRHILKSRVL